MPGVRFLKADITDADALAGDRRGWNLITFFISLHPRRYRNSRENDERQRHRRPEYAGNGPNHEDTAHGSGQQHLCVWMVSGDPLCPPDYMPVDEEHPCRPKDMYAATKRMQELLASVYYHEYHVPVTCLRLCAVIGPNGRGGGRGWRTIAEQLATSEYVQIPIFL